MISLEFSLMQNCIHFQWCRHSSTHSSMRTVLVNLKQVINVSSFSAHCTIGNIFQKHQCGGSSICLFTGLKSCRYLVLALPQAKHGKSLVLGKRCQKKVCWLSVYLTLMWISLSGMPFFSLTVSPYHKLLQITRNVCWPKPKLAWSTYAVISLPW